MSGWALAALLSPEFNLLDEQQPGSEA